MIFNMRRHSEREPKLPDLINLIDEQTTLLNEPLFLRGTVSQYNTEKKERFDKEKKMRSFLVKADSTKGTMKEILDSRLT